MIVNVVDGSPPSIGANRERICLFSSSVIDGSSPLAATSASSSAERSFWSWVRNRVPCPIVFGSPGVPESVTRPGTTAWLPTWMAPPSTKA